MDHCKTIPDSAITQIRALIQFMQHGSEIGRALWNFDGDLIDACWRAVNKAYEFAPDTPTFVAPEQNRKNAAARFQLLRPYLPLLELWINAGFSKSDLDSFRRAFADAMKDADDRAARKESEDFLKAREALMLDRPSPSDDESR